MLKLKIKEGVKRDIIVLTIPSRERQIGTFLTCLGDLDRKKYNIILVCNTEKNQESESFVKKVFEKYNLGSLPYQVVYNPEKTIPSGRNVGLMRSIQNIVKGTRLTYMIDDDIVIYKPKELFDFLEQGLQYAAFVGYPTFEVSRLPKTKRLAEANALVDTIVAKKELAAKLFNFLEVEKPRRYTPFRGEKYENAYVLYGHVHGNLQLHFTKVLEKLQKEHPGNGIFNQTRGWYGEHTELNYRLQRYGLIGGFLCRSPNKMEHLYNANEWGLIFHNDIKVAESPTRTMRRRNENMLRAYIYLAIESDALPFDMPKEEFLKHFLDLLNSDFRFLEPRIQEFAKLLQVRYSTQGYLFGTKSMSNERFERQRKKVIQKILNEIYSDKEIKESLLKRKIEYETTPFKLAPFQKFTKKGFNEFLRYQNEQLKKFREEIYDYG
ncbi:hypothetical protein KY361_01495 [Candidatus Woesearchaeota archaeon]|nr:hypothetical protein [Candidatus Woesearchaeota archaeon]